MKSLALPKADRSLIWAVLLLAGVGVVAVYSAGAYLVQTKLGGDTEGFLFGHLMRLGLALGVMGVVSLIDYRTIARFSKPFLIGALGLLIVVQVVGVATGGAQRWIDLGPVRFQPSDLAKVAVILHVAVLLAKKQDYIGNFQRAFVPLVIWAGATAVLIGMEDLSTAIVLCGALGAMMIVGRVRLLHLLGSALIGVLLATAFLATSPQRAARVESYLGVSIFHNTDAEEVHSSRAEGYQAEQARIAFALGGLTGVGPGKSTQKDYVPASYNDFIFAIIGEEYGLLGASFVLIVFVGVLLRGVLRIARGSPDPLGLFLATGLTMAFALYAFVNAAVATGLFPVTGLPMPLVSYGGTSMIVTGVMLGILLNVSRYADDG